MKSSSLFVLLLICIGKSVSSQVTSPAIRANFGVDADLRANFFNSFVQAGNDDWFLNDAGPGTFVIDTTGASYILQQYTSKPASRMFPFFRGMRYPQFSLINNKLLVDAVLIRDHHGDDSTVFASGSNKNGQHPSAWTTPISQGVPDKNDILDMLMHVRYDGPSPTDSLWLFGGVSLDATTGNRYFDFEMYQTDITYNRAGLNFTGFGPDAGHTSWKFDASGNLTAAGDIIFSAEYSSSSLSYVEARIWVHKDALLITPVAFTWGGSFDGATASSVYGYANILPKTAGNFYTGTQCGNNTWAGPFGLVLQNNAIATNYTARQFMEFSVNLTKLGLNSIVNQSDPCAMPFRRILVKSRSSTSFNAELKDFVGPFDFFRAPRASASATVPLFCGSEGHSDINVDNPLPTSLYVWSTPDGNIVGNNIGPQISVDMPGTYIVNQQLLDSCGVSYATDTVVVTQDNNCVLLPVKLLDFKSVHNGKIIQLLWRMENNESIKQFEIERRLQHSSFSTIGKITVNNGFPYVNYTFPDNVIDQKNGFIYYRLKIIDKNGNSNYSKVIVNNFSTQNEGIELLQNITTNRIDLTIKTNKPATAKIYLYDLYGRPHSSIQAELQKGSSIIDLKTPNELATGTYIIVVQFNNQSFTKKMLLLK